MQFIKTGFFVLLSVDVGLYLRFGTANEALEQVAWLILLVAGLCEIGWAVGLKYTEGVSRLWPSIGTLLAMVASVVLLGWSLKTLPLGTAFVPFLDLLILLQTVRVVLWPEGAR